LSFGEGEKDQRPDVVLTRKVWVSEIRVEAKDFFGFWKCNFQMSRPSLLIVSLVDGKFDVLNRSVVGSSIGHH